MASCLAIVAIVCVLITTVATIVAFSTPNWIEFANKADAASMLCSCASCDCGLWLQCTGGSLSTIGDTDNCKWFFDDDFLIERNLPDWFKATQGLMSCAIASTMLALLIGLFSLCCKCKGCNPNMAAGAFANLTFFLLAVSVCLFGAKANLSHAVTVIPKQNSLDPIFGWSFWSAVGASVMALISSLLYFCVGRKEDDYY